MSESSGSGTHGDVGCEVDTGPKHLNLLFCDPPVLGWACGVAGVLSNTRVERGSRAFVAVLVKPYFALLFVWCSLAVPLQRLFF